MTFVFGMVPKGRLLVSHLLAVPHQTQPHLSVVILDWGILVAHDAPVSDPKG